MSDSQTKSKEQKQQDAFDEYQRARGSSKTANGQGVG